MDIAESVIKLLFPDRCIICGDVTENNALKICKSCKELVRFTKDTECCRICSVPVEKGETLCTCCKTHRRYFVKNASAVVYEGAVRNTILRFKFEEKPFYYRGLAELIAAAVCERFKGVRFDMIAAVPLHKDRLKERGYNQAGLMAKYLSKKFSLPFADKELVKIRHTAAQSTLASADERFKNVKGAFAAAKREVFKGKTVLLTDDIFTTGATLNEVSKVIMNSGAKCVYTATAAAVAEKRVGI